MSGKVRGESYGYYIIRYVDDAKEGGIDLAEVKETIESSLLSTKQTDKYNETIQEWVDKADFKMNLAALDE